MTATTDLLAPVLRALSKQASASSDFDLNRHIRPDAPIKLRPAGVLVPLIRGENGLDVILTKRSSALKHHPGQIAFPGGKVDEGDASPVAAALREAHEEIGLSPELVTVLGSLPAHETVTAFSMLPVIAHVTRDFTPVPEPGEVDEVFRVPLSHVTDPARFRVEGRRWRGQMRHYYVVPWGPYYIWGATARVLRAMAEAIHQ